MVAPRPKAEVGSDEQQPNAAATEMAADEAGDILAEHLIRLMRAVAMPNGLAGLGYHQGDSVRLAEGALPQQRLLGNGPVDSDKALLESMFDEAVRYW